MIQTNSGIVASLSQLRHHLILPTVLIMLRLTRWLGSYHCLMDSHHPIYLTWNLNQHYT
ncbi:uncharacterized protein MELLADRAFT_94462 [Melampsora larici-populina 98AG31]|uniref:Uncharacterized protein n=1 Tax=Melampsora larici-populina (strain 98AG31 / pathotype 3-4-7) TaxID=747676 RepID=F4RB36_MELLP|nr:uncharacterized protein MELLADRAFT_94462 [Melampsora larici-populina 98AG31]EGG10330.1 hypothetical protein MELLADRAFT_94462 [Melampsora larici-populina 98AG31]